MRFHYPQFSTFDSLSCKYSIYNVSDWDKQNCRSADRCYFILVYDREEDSVSSQREIIKINLVDSRDKIKFIKHILPIDAIYLYFSNNMSIIRI